MSSLNEDIFFLAQTHHIRDIILSSTPKPKEEHEGKHLSLLNDIALLLVIKPKGDVCAVALRHTNQRIEFFYAKNAPCRRSLELYLANVKIILATAPSKSKMGEGLLQLICQTCLEKVRARIIKARQAINEYPMLCSESGLVPATALLGGRRPAWANKKDSEIIASVFREIRDMDISLTYLKNNIRAVMVLTRTACLIGDTQQIKPYERIARRIQKLGSYFGSIDRIILYLSRPDLTEFRDKIFFKEVSTYMPVSDEMSNDILQLLNKNGKQAGFDDVARKDFEMRFPQLSGKTTGFTKVTTSCHYELTIALHMARQYPTLKHIEIGVSKGLCYLCQEFLKQFTMVTKIPVIVSQYQGKIHAGWGMPPQAPDTMTKPMQDLIAEEVNEVREMLINRRRSDSFPNVGRNKLDDPPKQTEDLGFGW